MTNPFTAHPHAVGESYLEHCGFALRFGCRMAAGAAAAIIHAFLPFLFSGTAGRISDELQAMRQGSPGRLKQARPTAAPPGVTPH